MSRTKPIEPPPAIETDIPDGWALSTLGDGLVLDVQPGFACGTHNREGQGIGHLRPMNVSPEGEIALSNLKFVPASEADREERLVRAGDVIFNNTNSAELVGKTACYQLADPLAFSNHMTRLRCRRDAVEPRFCAMQLHHRWREGYFEQVCNHHVSQASVGRTVLLGTAFLLPPLPEQRRIVAKVEALLERVSAARARLAKVPAILKRFRQSVLTAACSGQLTAEWREHIASPASGVKLLQQIKRERAAAQARSRRPRRPGDGVEDSSAAPPVTWQVPDTWEWARVCDLLHYERSAAYGVLQPGSDVPNGVPFVRVCDLVNGTVDTRQIKRIGREIDKQYPRTRLHGDELLVTLVGTIGRIAVAPKELAGANVARAIGMLPLCPHVLPQYLRFAFDNPPKNAELVDLAREVARKTLNLGLLKAVTVPLPPLEEQREIVRRVERLFALADGIEARARAATVRAERLPQAVLTRAFRGELVPTEAQLADEEGREYESASALLERIQELRNQQPAQRGRGGKRMMKRARRQAAKSRRPLAEVLREQGKPLTTERLFDLAGFDESTVDEFYAELRKLIQERTVRERRPNGKDVTLETVGA